MGSRRTALWDYGLEPWKLEREAWKISGESGAGRPSCTVSRGRGLAAGGGRRWRGRRDTVGRPQANSPGSPEVSPWLTSSAWPLPSDLRAGSGNWAVGPVGFMTQLLPGTQTCFPCSFLWLELWCRLAGKVRMSYFLVSVPMSGSFKEDLIILCGLNLGTRASWKYKHVTWACWPLGNPLPEQLGLRETEKAPGALPAQGLQTV